MICFVEYYDYKTGETKILRSTVSRADAQRAIVEDFNKRFTPHVKKREDVRITLDKEFRVFYNSKYVQAVKPLMFYRIIEIGYVEMTQEQSQRVHVEIQKILAGECKLEDHTTRCKRAVGSGC